MTAKRRPPLPILTTLRFFAAAEVVAFHIAIATPGWTGPRTFLEGLISGGYAAVTFFFVLSGFILTYVHSGPGERDGCDVPAATFWRMRFARIAPAYYLALLIALPALVSLVLRMPNESLGLDLLLEFLLLQAWYPSAKLVWNLPAWSVSVECLFYALFPVLAPAMARLSRPMALVVAYGLVIAATACRAEFLAWPGTLAGRPDLQFQAYFPLLLLPQFIFGMVLGRLFAFGPSRPATVHAAMLGIGTAALVIAFGFGDTLPWWVRSDMVLVVMFGLVIFGGAGATSIVPMLARPTPVLLGEASYAIYILHVPLIFWWAGLRSLGLPAWLSVSVYVAMVLVVSLFVYRRVEVPLRRLIAGPKPRPRLA